MYSCHGAQKLFGVLGGTRADQPLMMVAGVIEFGGGVLILIGFLTGIAAFLASGEMAAAYFMVHAKGGFFPIINKGELAVVYCFLFLYIAAHGAGRWSIDGLKRRSLP
jgi:putative oxidoreductase